MKVGLDVGSTTIKCVVLDDADNLVYSTYERHYSHILEKSEELLRRVADQHGAKADLAISGSAGMGMAESVQVPFVQEVFATRVAANKLAPGTDCIIELGGEDAKILFLTGGMEVRMNGSCAGGTGAFIDQMATLMNVSVDELDALSLKHEKIYPIASRCGVFAKSDIQPILNQGGRKEDVAASIFQAVVDQTVAGLTQGRELKGKIVFLGGPLHFLMGLRERFVETLKLDEEHAIFPEDGDCFAAMGAALCSSDYDTILFEDALKKLEESVDTTTLVDTMPPLFQDVAEYGTTVLISSHNLRELEDVCDRVGIIDRTPPPTAGTPGWASTPAPPPPRWPSSPQTADCSTPIITPIRATLWPSCWSSSGPSTASAERAFGSRARPSPAMARISSKTPSAVT